MNILLNIANLFASNLWALLAFLVIAGVFYFIWLIVEKIMLTFGSKIDKIADSLGSLAKDVTEIKEMVIVEKVKSEEKFNHLEERIEKIETKCDKRHEK